MADDNRITTPPFRVSFPAVFEKKLQPNNKMQYSISMLFPKDTDLSELQKFAGKAVREGFGSVPKDLKKPFKDGNLKVEKYQSHKDMIVVETRTDYRPEIVGPDGKTLIEDSEEFYAGCWARAKVNVFTWDNVGGKGVSFGLSNLQKIRDVPVEERFETKYSATEDFGAVEGASDGDSGDAEASSGEDWLN